MNKTLMALSAVGMVSASAAHATEGLYGGFGMGASLMHSQGMDAAGGGAASFDTDHDLGPAANLSLGYGLKNGLRLELEAGYGFNQIDSMDGVAATGDAEAFSYMGNVYYDFYNSTAFTPYVGAGAGGMTLLLDDYVTPANGRISKKDTSFVAQGIAGITYDFSNYVDLYADYRYLASLKDFEYNTNSGALYDSDYKASTFMLGLRVALNKKNEGPAVVEPQVQDWRPVQAPPPPPPTQEKMAPREPSEISRSYLVFFDFDRSSLTTAAQDVIGKAVQDAQSVDLIRFEVTGHADRSGANAYNDKLSLQRAETVKKKLVAMGIPADLISVRAKGENEPLIPTDDGVREPQNRRVEILYTVRK
ncbi:MAG: OmpA family protein [Rickettsiales bacterium]